MKLPQFAFPVVFVAAAAPAFAQAEATTLARLTDRSAVVAQVRCLGSRVRGTTRMTTFKVVQSLKGKAPATLVLSEDARRACGSALHGVVPGAGFVAFLKDSKGALELTMPSARALVALEPGLNEHVRTLSGAAGKTSDVVLPAFDSKSRRVREDAVMTIAGLRLQSLTAASKTTLLQLLPSLLDNGSVAAQSALRLVDRFNLQEATQPLLQRYLAGTNLAPVLLELLPRLDAAAVASTFARGLPQTRIGRLRAVRLLRHCPGAEASRCLRSMLRGQAKAVAVEAASALLQRGDSRQSVVRISGEHVVGAAERALASPPAFRVIRPER